MWMVVALENCIGSDENSLISKDVQRLMCHEFNRKLERYDYVRKLFDETLKNEELANTE